MTYSNVIKQRFVKVLDCIRKPEAGRQGAPLTLHDQGPELRHGRRLVAVHVVHAVHVVLVVVVVVAAVRGVGGSAWAVT